MCPSMVIRFKGVLEFNTWLDTMIVENTYMYVWVQQRRRAQFPPTISIIFWILSTCIWRNNKVMWEMHLYCTMVGLDAQSILVKCLCLNKIAKTYANEATVRIQTSSSFLTWWIVKKFEKLIHLKALEKWNWLNIWNFTCVCKISVNQCRKLFLEVLF